jgi:hypothetical protein
MADVSMDTSNFNSIILQCFGREHAEEREWIMQNAPFSSANDFVARFEYQFKAIGATQRVPDIYHAFMKFRNQIDLPCTGNLDKLSEYFQDLNPTIEELTLLLRVLILPEEVRNFVFDPQFPPVSCAEDMSARVCAWSAENEGQARSSPNLTKASRPENATQLPNKSLGRPKHHRGRRNQRASQMQPANLSDARALDGHEQNLPGIMGFDAQYPRFPESLLESTTLSTSLLAVNGRSIKAVIVPDFPDCQASGIGAWLPHPACCRNSAHGQQHPSSPGGCHTRACGFRGLAYESIPGSTVRNMG